MSHEIFLDFIQPRMMTVPIEGYSNNGLRGGVSGGGVGAAPDALEWNFTKNKDKANIEIFRTAVNGRGLGTVTLRALKDGKLFYRVLLPNAFVSGFNAAQEQDAFTIVCEKPVYFVARG